MKAVCMRPFKRRHGTLGILTARIRLYARRRGGFAPFGLFPGDDIFELVRLECFKAGRAYDKKTIGPPVQLASKRLQPVGRTVRIFREHADLLPRCRFVPRRFLHGVAQFVARLLTCPFSQPRYLRLYLHGSIFIWDYFKLDWIRFR
jgi:hypothetical protein